VRRISSRHDHQTAAISTKQVPSGSGMKNAPKVASVVGDLIWRIFIFLTVRFRKGSQDGELNK